MNWKRTHQDASLDSLCGELRKLPAPEPSSDLLPRILASRAAGVRLILPVADPPGPVRRSLSAAAVAAAAAGLGWLALFVSGVGSHKQRVFVARAPAELFEGTLLAPMVAFGQEPGVWNARPSYPLIDHVDGARLQEGRWTYQLRSTTDDIFTRTEGHSALAAVKTLYAGSPAWLFTSDDIVVDSVWVDALQLRPLSRTRHTRNGRLFLLQQFARDSVTELLKLSGPDTARTLHESAALPGPVWTPLLVRWSPFHLEALLQTVPLERHWRGSVYVVNWVSMAARGIAPAFTPLDLRVVGAEAVTVPAGTFDCWKVEVRQAASKVFLWVSKDRQWVVKSWQRAAPDWVTERLLVSATGGLTPPAP